MRSLNKGYLTKIIIDALREAEKTYNRYKLDLGLEGFNDVESMSIEDIASIIPPNNIVEYENLSKDNKVVVDDFIVIAVKLFNTAIVKTESQLSLLEGVYYRAKALNATVKYIIDLCEDHDTKVSEYSNDSILIFFRIPKKDDSSKLTDSIIMNNTIVEASKAAHAILKDARMTLNSILAEKYQLSKTHISIVMAYSQAVLNITDAYDDSQVQAFGKCIFYAKSATISSDNIIVHKSLYDKWPTSENGKLGFKELANQQQLKYYEIVSVK